MLVYNLIFLSLGCTKKLLDWKPALCKQADASGWTPLHYAALFGHVTRAKELLNTDKSVAYIADKDNKKIALHLAVSQGHVRVMEELISRCPDCWEMVDGRGQNILHMAAKYKKKRAIKFILEKFSFSSLINQKDSDGNTPLHLLAASGCCQASLIKHPKSDRMAFNKENLTPVDVICKNKKIGAVVRILLYMPKYVGHSLHDAKRHKFLTFLTNPARTHMVHGIVTFVNFTSFSE